MNSPDNINNEIESDVVYQVDVEPDKKIGKKKKRLIAKVEENLLQIVKEKISGRMGEC